MNIAITLLTCDRLDYTKRTLETLREHNPDLTGVTLLHGDDASLARKQTQALTEAAGFETVEQSRGKRRGVAEMTARLFKRAQEAGATYVLNLQNDWECLRPIPFTDIFDILGDPRVYCLRLYGRMKSPSGKCGLHHGGREPRRLVDWTEYRPGYEIGDIHWGHPPSVTRIRHAIKLTDRAPCESVSRKRSGAIYEHTVRVVDNVFNHIGRERTVGFVP